MFLYISLYFQKSESGFLFARNPYNSGYFADIKYKNSFGLGEPKSVK